MRGMKPFNGGNVLVAGGTSFVGINLIRRLLSSGAHIRATIHRKDPVIQGKRIEYIIISL
jgi:nucleoside-diphosphate-sugar epimerase